MNIDKLWSKVQSFEEPGKVSEKTLEVFNEIIFSTQSKFGEIREFVERVDKKSLDWAIQDIMNIPSMESGEDDYDDDDNDPEKRYFLYANDFRERHLLGEFSVALWSKAKPKGKKRFF